MYSSFLILGNLHRFIQFLRIKDNKLSLNDYKDTVVRLTCIVEICFSLICVFASLSGDRLVIVILVSFFSFASF